MLSSDTKIDLSCLNRSIQVMLFVLIAACSGGDAGGDAFEISVTGAYQTEFDGSGTQRVSYQDAVPGLETYVFEFSNKDYTQAVSLLFYTTEPPESGSYDIGHNDADDIGGTVLAIFVDRNDTAVFDYEHDGSVTLTRSGDSYSGEFTFTSKGGPLTNHDLSVAVKGQFKGFQLQ